MPKPYSSLPPHVEQRLAGWEQVQFRISIPHERKLRPTVTISREFGCEGFPLAERLKVLLEQASSEPWNIYDKSLIEKVAQEEGISLRLLQNLGDMSRALQNLGVLHPAGHVTHDAAFEKMTKYLVEIASVGNAIVVGRGGAILCRELRNCFHFRIVASHDWRVSAMMRRLELSREEAETLVKESGTQREKFISRYLGEDLSALKHYDAVLNNERHSVEQMAAAILAYVRSGWEDRAYFKG